MLLVAAGRSILAGSTPDAVLDVNATVAMVPARTVLIGAA